MNAAIRAVVRFGLAHGCEVYGIQKGYSGLLDGEIVPLNASSVANCIQRGGTILKTARCPEFHKKSARKEAAHILRRKGIEGMVVIGGDGTYAGAHLLEKESGFPVVGVPGTIDNDVYGTEETIGFDTAVNTAVEAIDRIRDTASSHDRIFLVEVMGRSAGFIALEVGIGGGAESIIVPERPASVDGILAMMERGIKRGKTSSIIVVAEGSKPGLTVRVAQDLKKQGYDPKVCTLGHIQRGGSPTAHDRMLASVLGAAAVGYLLTGRSAASVGVRDGRVVRVPFASNTAKRRDITDSILNLAGILAI
jgi:6-phosphofructokinase 1